MATNLQVNANTQQAVGAFNQLAQAIAGARGQFQNLNVVLANGATAARTYGNAVTQNITAGFSQLQAVAQGLFTALRFVGAGIELVFSSLIRELDKLQGFNAIMSVTTKTSEEVAGSFDFVRKTADKLGVQFDAISGNYAKLTAAIPEGTNRLDIAQRAFLGVAMAARTMHATNQDTGLMFYAITQIASKGIVSMEELRRQLGEKLPGVIQIAAKALNTVPEELEKAIRKGIVVSEKFLPIFGDALIRTFADSAEKAATSVSASMNRLTNVWVDFVKVVLDSGAGNSIVGVFDALREKLSDPYLISRFADFIKTLADRFAELIRGLTSEDIRNGFDTFARGVQFLITLMEKLVNIFTWIINNGVKAGAIIGGLAGVAVGAAFGPVGAAVGLAAGAGAGAYAGNSLSATPEERRSRTASDLRATQEKAAATTEQQRIKDQIIMPMLQQFRSLNSLKDVDKLLQPDRLNVATATQLADILSGRQFKTDGEKLGALKDLNKTGIILNPATAQLKDVLGGTAKSNKASAGDRSLDATFWKANGFDGNFPKEKGNLDTLFKQGKLDVEAYEKAYGSLLSKQPFMEEEIRKQRKAQESYNRVTSEMIELALRYVDVKEEVNASLADELRLAGMRSEDRGLESQVMQVINKYKEVGKDLTLEEVSILREKYRVINQIQQLTAAEDQVLNATVDKYRDQLLVQQAMSKLSRDPKSGFSSADATNYTVTQDPNMQGSAQWITAQKAQLQDYYAFVDGLRANDRINEESALTAKATAFTLYEQKIRDAYVKAAQLRLEAGNTTWIDVAISSLGRLAQGFTNLNAGATAAMGSFFQSFTDGFSNSVGRAIVYSEDLGDALKNVAREGVAALISALVKLGIQWLVNAVLGRSIAAASAATGLALTVATATATAAAWAPAAAMASLATLGANAAPAMAGITSTVALSEGLALLSGFKEGGFTGYGGTNQIAGVVHGQEFVVNSSATSRNRSALEAMNRGATVANTPNLISNGGSGPSVSVIINNNAPDTTTSQRERDTPNGKEIEVTIERVVAGNIRSGGKIASAVEAQYGLNRATGSVR